MSGLTRYLERVRRTGLFREDLLKSVNRHVNECLTYTKESVLPNTRDVWQTPRETIEKGTGDCEDYAILKFYLLKELGFNPDNLNFCFVFDKISYALHMVLLAKVEDQIYLLDSKKNNILKFETVTNYVMLARFNEEAMYSEDFDNFYTYQKPIYIPQYAEMLEVHKGEGFP